MTASEHKKHWCPACDAGWVERVTIAPINQRGWLCGECEAFWPYARTSAITHKPFVQFGVWVGEQGVGDEVRVVRG